MYFFFDFYTTYSIYILTEMLIKRLSGWSFLSIAENCIFTKRIKNMKMKFNQSKLKLAIASTIVVGSIGISTASYANDSMDVTTTVGAGCVVSIATTMTFDTYAPVTTHALTDLTKSSNITAQCTDLTAAIISLSGGANNNNSTSTQHSAPTRRMRIGSSTNYLNYDLNTTDSASGTEWGSNAGVDAGGVAYTGNGTSETLTVYGRIPAAQNVATGSYTDTVVVTIDLG